MALRRPDDRPLSEPWMAYFIAVYMCRWASIINKSVHILRWDILMFNKTGGLKAVITKVV